MKYGSLFLPLLLLLQPAASAYDYVAGYKDWSVYQDTVQGEPVCYAVTRATDKSPKSATHGDVVFFVTFYQSTSMPQSSLRVDFDLREDLKARLAVGGSSWALYSVKNEAFANSDDETSIANSLKRGSELKVEAVSGRNTSVSYHFSLSGSANAIDKAQSLCG